MQTFLPYADFKKTAACLDLKRLGKQRIEAYKILKTLRSIRLAGHNPYKLREIEWRHHPAVNMWKRHDGHLIVYAVVICEEWMKRGYEDGINERLKTFVMEIPQELFEPAPWIGDVEFHRSHQSNLVRKNPEYYRQFFPDVPNNLDYVWPEP